MFIYVKKLDEQILLLQAEVQIFLHRTVIDLADSSAYRFAVKADGNIGQVIVFDLMLWDIAVRGRRFSGNNEFLRCFRFARVILRFFDRLWLDFRNFAGYDSGDFVLVKAEPIPGDKPLRRLFIYRCFRIIFKPVGKYGLITCGEVSRGKRQS